MNTVVLQLLQVAATLLLAAQTHAGELSPALTAQFISFASRAVQLGTQALAPQPVIPAISSKNIWPNISGLRNAFYINSEGVRVRLGNGIRLLEEYTSFGDMNGDGFDEALVVTSEGTTSYALAAFLNQGGILFNVAAVPLPKNLVIYSHRIESGIFSIELRDEAGAKKKLLYKLLGNTLISV
ncbi:MAG: hypothetical protein A3B25_00635 [Candidatus Ryanbacteria bacterium RIFCSPLOWO2_01_FULL_48_26]|uniref:VCBS repeat-containing protein n=1 Tax=Candidatus Ryanbacteria bacterium RIFCSPLOWO2_01_FULL_48_26 TaxID=1802126 RepID=A0A1G2GTQ6_9BACT|nr:MAG: hypothetical protein A3B25_00635 [Candidatus Ryanbacteria bacterium RIFCSPLOWO2_01_FULL_48_26]